MGKLLNDLDGLGLHGKHFQLLITDDGCPGLAGAIQRVYPRVLHQARLGTQDAQPREKGCQWDRDETGGPPAVGNEGLHGRNVNHVPLGTNSF